MRNQGVVNVDSCCQFGEIIIFSSSFSFWQSKLDRLPMASFFSQVQNLCMFIIGMLGSSHTQSYFLGSKSFIGQNTLAYFASGSMTKEKTNVEPEVSPSGGISSTVA